MNWMRLVTIVAAVGTVVAGALIPGAQVIIPIGTALAGWAIPHMADRRKTDK
jgi:uncharacterized membrane protein